MAKKPSYLKAAFLYPANLLALLAGGVSSVLVQDPTPALVALGLQGLYLGVMPFSEKFRRGVRAQQDHGADEAHTVALVEELAPSQREHYFALKELRDKILANYGRLPGGGVLAANSEGRLDQLLSNFLRLLGTLNNYRKYLSASDRAAIERELAEVREDVAAETNARVREVKQKRGEILEQRLQRFQQVEESREIVSHQLASIEDLLRLTHERSISIRDPDAIGHQLDALSAEVAATDETVREMERFMEFTEELSSLPSVDRSRVRT